MRRRKLAIALEAVDGFTEPRPELEQYETSAELASRLLHLADQNDDLGSVVDLGCGTGMLSLGAALLGADSVGVDVDRDALSVAVENAGELDVDGQVEFVRGDVGALPLEAGFDVAVMNPPFGAQDRGADRVFLEAAEDVADVVYSIHNEGSMEFVEGFVDGEMTHAFEAEISIDHRFEFHEEEVRSVPVEVYRIESG